jgi:hypothetical protein
MIIHESTRADIRAYQKKTNEILRKVGKIDKDAVKKVSVFLRQMRADIADAVTRATGFDQLHFTQILSDIEGAINVFQQRYHDVLISAIGDAWQGGKELIDLPLAAANIRFAPSPVIDLDYIEFLQQYSASLIKDLGKQIQRRVDSALRLAMLGAKNSNEAMAEVGKILRKRTVYDAERIVRTEVSRTLNLSAQRRMQDADDKIPELRKYWLHTTDSRVRPSHLNVGYATNPNFGGTPIRVNEKFTIGGERVNGPHDPALSAEETINCRCRVVTILI